MGELVYVCSWAMLAAALAGCAVQSGLDKEWPMGPGPGDVYREYTYGRRFGQVDPGAAHPDAQGMKAQAGSPKSVSIDDLDGAWGAEVSVQYWGGHIGTAGQAFTVNGRGPFDIPQPAGTPKEPQTYYRTVIGDNPVAIPLEVFRKGRNVFQFRAGSQIRYGFKWGFFWVYSFTTRVYYKPSKPHVAGSVTTPATGATIDDNPTITAKVDAGPDKVRQVDFIACYEDFDWEGNGLFRQWHYQFHAGRMSRHIGTAVAPPYSVMWDTTWVPDQGQPLSIMARIVGTDGTMYMTPAVTGVVLARPRRSVKMYKPSKVPENFGVRVGARKSCFIDVSDPLDGTTRAQLVLSTWSAAHAEEIGLNDKALVERVGLVHDFSFDAIPVPLDLIQPSNRFFIYSSTVEHAAEVNWPGPVLMVEFTKE